MSSSGQQPVTQTQNTTPWGPSQPYLTQQLEMGANLVNTGQGYVPYSGQMQAPLNSQLSTGLDSEYQIAASDPYGVSKNITDARSLADQYFQNNGMTPELKGVAGQMNQIFNNASGQTNPYLLSTIAANDRRIADKVNSSVSGAGRYGSGAHTDVLGRSLAEAADPILAQDYAQRQQQMQGAANSLQGLYSAAGQSAGQWAQLAPALDEARYAGAGHIQNVGNFMQNRSQQDIADQIAYYNAVQARPWEQLQRYQAAISGPGALGGTKVTATTPIQPSTLQRIGGAAATGAGIGSIFGAPGAGIGAGVGGLLGLL